MHVQALAALLLITISFAFVGCRTHQDKSNPQDVEIQVLPDGSMIIETNWYNAFPTQQAQAIHAALETAGSKLDEMMPGLDIRQQLIEHAGEIDFATAVRFGQAVLDSEINFPDQLKGLKLGDLPPKGFVVLVGGGPLDRIEIREGFEISATVMFTFIPRLYYRKIPGEDDLRAYYRFKVGVSVLTLKPFGLQKVAQVARLLITRGLATESVATRPDQLVQPIKVGVGLIFGDVTAPEELYSSVIGGRLEFQTSYFSGPLAHLNGGYRAQAIVINEEILTPVPKALILSLERLISTGSPEIAPPHLVLGGNISIGFIVDRLQRFFSADLLQDENGDVSVLSTREFPIRSVERDSESGVESSSQGYEDEF